MEKNMVKEMEDNDKVKRREKRKGTRAWKKR